MSIHRIAALAAAVVFIATSVAQAGDPFHIRYGRGAHHGHAHHHHHGGSHLSFSIGVPRIYSARSFYFSTGYPYGYDSYSYGYGSPYGTYYLPSSNYVEYNLPPVYYPAELGYGPQAVKQFMGVDRNFALGPLLNPTDRDALTRPEVTRVLSRVSNLETLRRAEKYVRFGDDLFREQKYHEALQQYKQAASTAPDLARSYYRQAHALIATSRPELAMAALKRGLTADARFVDSGFLLDEIYGEARLAKTAHLEALAKMALDRPDGADLLFLLGSFLHFDGEPDRARKFFLRAAELNRGDDAHLRAFLGDDVIPVKESAPLERAARGGSDI